MSEVHVDPSVTAPPSGFPVYTDPGEFREKFFRPRAEALRGSKRRIPLSEVIGTTIVEPFFKQTRDELVAQRQQDKVTTVPIWWLLLTVTGLIHTVWAAFFQVVGMSIEAVGREVSNWKQVMLTGEAAPSIAVIWLRGATPSDDLFLLRAKSIAGALGYRLRFESASARDAFLQSKISQHTGNPFGFAQDETIEIPDATAEGGTRKETAYYVVTDVVVAATYQSSEGNVLAHGSAVPLLGWIQRAMAAQRCARKGRCSEDGARFNEKTSTDRLIEVTAQDLQELHRELSATTHDNVADFALVSRAVVDNLYQEGDVDAFAIRLMGMTRFSDWT